MTDLLDVRDLQVDFDTPTGPIRVIDRLNLTVRAGERVALVGESGSGKSVTAQAILGLLPTARVTGSVRVAGQEIVGAPNRVLRRIRGGRVGLVFQDPLAALNPVMTIGKQVMEPLLIRGVRKAEAKRRAIDLLSRLGVRDAANRFNDYPHQFSGGMRQRVVIAIAMIAEPDLLIAGEPTTALTSGSAPGAGPARRGGRRAGDGGPAHLTAWASSPGSPIGCVMCRVGRWSAGVHDIFAQPRHRTRKD